MARKYPLLLALLALAGCSAQAADPGDSSAAGGKAAGQLSPAPEPMPEPSVAGAPAVAVGSSGAAAEAGATAAPPEQGGGGSGGSGGSVSVPELGGTAGEPSNAGATSLGGSGSADQDGTAGTATSAAGAPPDTRLGQLRFHWTGGCEAGSGGQVTVHLLDAAGAPFGGNAGDYTSACAIGVLGIMGRPGTYSYSVKLVELCVDPVTYERVHCTRVGASTIAPAQTLDVQLGTL